MPGWDVDVAPCRRPWLSPLWFEQSDRALNETGNWYLNDQIGDFKRTLQS